MQRKPSPLFQPPAAAGDLNELASFRAALSSAHSFAHALADSLPGIVYLFDNQAQLLWWNQAFERVTGYSPDELASAPLERASAMKRVVNRPVATNASATANSERSEPNAGNST